MGIFDFLFGSKEKDEKDKAFEERLANIQKEQEEAEAEVEKIMNQAVDPALMEPIEGVSCETWAKGNATIVNNGDWTDDVLALIDGDKAKWTRVDLGWQERMAQDQSFTISNVYSEAFFANAKGNLDVIDENTFPFKKYIELQVADEILIGQGKDSEEVFKIFDITLQDYVKINDFWGKKQHEYSERLSTFETIHEDDEYEAAEIARLNEAFKEDESFRQWAQDQEAWTEEFKEKYSTADTTEDIAF